jgi:hypothetical protein
LYLAMAMILYAALRRIHLKRVYSAGLVAIAMCTPAMARWAGAGYSDVPLAAFYTASSIYTVRWLEDGQGKHLVLAILFAAFAAFTKNEGLALEGITVLVLLGWCGLKQQRVWIVQTAASALAFFVLLLPFLIWRAQLPRTHEDYRLKISPAMIIANRSRLLDILPALGDELFNPRKQGAVWIILLIAAALGSGAFRRGPVIVLWFLIVLHLCLYILVYIVTPHQIDELLIGIHWAAVGGDGGEAR